MKRSLIKLSKKVLIVGAGIGGLAAGVRLLSRGYKVKIFEKEASIGGKIQPLKAGNFNFDLTASILMAPKVYQELFVYANRDYMDYLQFIKVDPNYRVHYEDGTNIDFSSNLADLISALESISHDDALGSIRFQRPIVLYLIMLKISTLWAALFIQVPEHLLFLLGVSW